MHITTVVVIGAGPAGLATSRSLTDASIDHVLLERAEVAHSWRHERWDSLRTLTPNWMNRLPGHPYNGPDPEGYMTASEVAASLERYRETIDAPVRRGVNVTSLRRTGDGWLVDTDHGPWRSRAVVVAAGAGADSIPALAAELPDRIEQITASRYRNPGQLGTGPVLVVGASASGSQIADELARSGRAVTLAVGEHVRLPRVYRGRDIHWWMDAMGVADERHDEVDDLARARRVPSPQLVGSAEHRSLDLNSLRQLGVAPVGRAVGIARGRVQFSGSLANLAVSADLKQQRLLDRIDEFAAGNDLDELPATRPEPTVIGAAPTEVELAGIDTVVWATGHQPGHLSLDGLPVDVRGRLVHDGGVAPMPGLYLLGLPFLRRRSSSFLRGIGADALELTAQLQAHLDLVAAA